MKRLALASVILMAVTFAPSLEARADSVLRNAVVSCSYGAGAFAAVAYVYVAPLAASGALAVPLAEVVAVNALLGCGFGVAGSLTASVVGGLYDVVAK